jgi:hypothetical protein
VGSPNSDPIATSREHGGFRTFNQLQLRPTIDRLGSVSPIPPAGATVKRRRDIGFPNNRARSVSRTMTSVGDSSQDDRIREATRALWIVADMARQLPESEFLESAEWNAVDGAEQAVIDVLVDFDASEPPQFDAGAGVDLADAGKLVLDELWQVGRDFPPGSGLLAGLGTYARPMGLWIGVIAWAFGRDKERARNLVETALLFPTLDTVTGARHPLEGVRWPGFDGGSIPLTGWSSECQVRTTVARSSVGTRPNCGRGPYVWCTRRSLKAASA